MASLIVLLESVLKLLFPFSNIFCIKILGLYFIVTALLAPQSIGNAVSCVIVPK